MQIGEVSYLRHELLVVDFSTDLEPRWGSEKMRVHGSLKKGIKKNFALNDLESNGLSSKLKYARIRLRASD